MVASRWVYPTGNVSRQVQPAEQNSSEALPENSKFQVQYSVRFLGQTPKRNSASALYRMGVQNSMLGIVFTVGRLSRTVIVIRSPP